jgi:hypothetical protein
MKIILKTAGREERDGIAELLMARDNIDGLIAWMRKIRWSTYFGIRVRTTFEPQCLRPS